MADRGRGGSHGGARRSRPPREGGDGSRLPAAGPGDDRLAPQRPFPGQPFRGGVSPPEGGDRAPDPAAVPAAGRPATGGPPAAPWTDLALEAVREAAPLDGVHVEEQTLDGVQVSRVTILTDEAARRVGKRRGHYVTIESPELKRRNRSVQDQAARVLQDELRRLMRLEENTAVLVVGLGNWNATPDALGPRVVANLLVTRHLRSQVPPDLAGGLRSVAAVAPGVLGLTGIETGEIIRGIVDRIRPDVILAVDALASRSLERILTTIQIADTGIHPGSGVGNDRGGLTEETLGIPVVAIGVPTVVHAVTIAHDTLELLARRLPSLGSVGAEERRHLVEEVLAPTVGDLMVTPKEIDALVDDMARVLASGINAALHPRLDQAAVF